MHKLLWLYSLWFRLGGLVMAILSAIVSTAIGVGVVRNGFILVNGHQSTDLESIGIAVCTPLLGVVVGLALFYFVPKVPREKPGSAGVK